MRMRDELRQGALLGIMSGCITIIFDGMLVLKTVTFATHIPAGYLVGLFVFNIVFWMLCGMLAGLSCGVLCPFLPHRISQTMACWVVFFVAPFAAVYGLLSRVPIPHITDNIRQYWPPAVYDSHLSFVWVSVLVFVLCLRLKKNPRSAKVLPLEFSIDIAFIIMLFLFCSEPLSYPDIRIFNTISAYIADIIGVSVRVLLALYYVAGTVCLFAGYFLFSWIVRPRLSSVSARRPLAILCSLAACAVLFLGFIYVYGTNTQYMLTAGRLEALRAGERKQSVPRVILIVLDTLRADRTSVYNSTLDTTPHLEKFAQESLVFEDCIAPSPWTPSSHASLFTGYSVSEHEVDLCYAANPRLDDDFVTLAEVFKKQGYATAAVVSNFSMHPLLNFQQGFQVWDAVQSIGVLQRQRCRPIMLLFPYMTGFFTQGLKVYRSAHVINSNAMAVIEAAGDRPFFLFLNYMENHSPYFPPHPFNNTYVNATVQRLYGLSLYAQRCIGTYDKEVWDAYLLAQYDGETAYLDSKLGDLLDYLKYKELYDSSFIIVTSDHGELFGEHGLYEHRCRLYDGVVKVPLVVKFPFSSHTGIVKSPINLTDVYATILSVCGLPVPEGVAAQAFGGPRSPVSEYCSRDETEVIMYDGAYKYKIYSDNKNISGPVYELFDISADPAEERNLADALPIVANRMHENLQGWLDSRRVVIADEDRGDDRMPDAIKEKLRSLGYIQ